MLPFPVEESSAEVRVVSTGKRTEFRKRDGKASQFVDILKQIGEIPADQEPILKEVLAAIKDYRVARSHPRWISGSPLPCSPGTPAGEQ